MLPQVEEVLENFSEIEKKIADVSEVPELAGYLSIFTAPVLILFDEGKEILREARFVHIDEFERKIGKIYDTYFSS